MKKTAADSLSSLSRKQIERKYLRARKLGSKEGFFKAFFDELKNTKYQYEAFDNINNEYRELFGSDRYSCYESFVRAHKNNLRR